MAATGQQNGGGLELQVYDGRARYSLSSDSDGITLSYPVPAGTRLRDIELEFSNVSIRVALKRSPDRSAIVEGKLWAPVSTPPEPFFEEDTSGRLLMIPFRVPADNRDWPVLIRGPRTASLDSIDAYSAYLLGLVLSDPQHPYSARPADGVPMLQLAAKNGVVEAQFHLAQLYSDAHQAAIVGLSPDAHLALSYFLPVAKTQKIGHFSKITFADIGEAQYRLGEAYETGHGGVTKHLETAVEWYTRAMLNENAAASQRLAELDAAEQHDLDEQYNQPQPSARPVPTPAGRPVVDRRHRPKNSKGLSFWHFAAGAAFACVVAGLVYEVAYKKKD